ncbi:MAG: hypothetical protein RIC57_10390 [Balneola sp.]|jgi:hypothetical protein|tara:strand:- start:54413 stop:54835 length:423 start_codon:yes stop_codon:yes gene_type:complete
MKTLETVLKTISLEGDTCDNCKAKEGIEHPIRGMKVKLKSIPGESIPNKYCQICFIQKSTKPKTEKKKDMLLLIKKFSLVIALICALLLVLSISVYAQPPGLPGDPAQAPIDGGLGLLAAAGGAYAYKKLKDKNKEDDLL